MNGTLYGTSAQGIRLRLDWSVSYNTNTMKATFTINVYMEIADLDPHFDPGSFAVRARGGYNWNYIKINNNIVAQFTRDQGNGTQSNPYLMYTTTSNPNADGLVVLTHWVTPSGDQYGTFYAKAWAHFVTNYQIETDIDDDGHTSFNIDALLTYYTDNDKSILNATVIPSTPAETSSKIKHKGASGWDNSGRIWHKENNKWVKRNLYRRVNNTWNRV